MKINKKDLKKLREIAKTLPGVYNKDIPAKRQKHGSTVIAEGGKEDKTGNPIDPNAHYDFELKGLDVNHLKKLKKAYLRFGWEGVEWYKTEVWKIKNRARNKTEDNATNNTSIKVNKGKPPTP